MQNRPPLRSDWVDRVFDRLQLAYGHLFLGRWSGFDIAAVKRAWAEELAGFADHPEALKYALEHLPPNDPPTAIAFRNLCRDALREDRHGVVKLPAPVTPPPPEAVEALHRLQTAMTTEPADHRSRAQQCIDTLREIEKTRPLTAAQRAMLESCERVTIPSYGGAQ